jgi:hypothetical protein
MKLALATLALVASMVAAPAVAQMSQDMSNTTDAAELTLSGTVVSVTADTLVLRTDAGEKTIKLSSLTIKPDSLAPDARVTVTYRDEAGEMVASNIVLETEAIDSSAVASADVPAAPPAESSTYESTPPAESAVADADVDADVSADLDADGDTDVAAGVDSDLDTDADADALPATASKIPLLALLGALSMGAALVLRRVS